MAGSPKDHSKSPFQLAPASRRPRYLGTVFITLMLGFLALGLLDTFLLLEPRLRSESTGHMQNLLTSHAAHIVDLIETRHEGSPDDVLEKAVASILSQENTRDGTTLVAGVRLVLQGQGQSRVFNDGESDCGSCIWQSTPLVVPETGTGYGTLSLGFSADAFLSLRDDVRDTVLVWIGGLIAMMATAWWVLGLQKPDPQPKVLPGRILFDAAPTPLMLIDPDNREIIDANEAMRDLIGERRLIGTRIDELIEPGDFPKTDCTGIDITRTVDTYLSLFEGRLATTLTVRLVDTGGRLVCLVSVADRVQAEPSLDAAGHPTRQSDALILPEFLQEIVDDFQVTARRKGLDLLYQAPTTLPVLVETDAFKLRDLLHILLDNAIEKTPRGGLELRVDFAPALGRPILTLSVSDTGVGIDGDAQKRLFQPAFRAGRATTGPTRNMGQGLAAARQLCDALGAAIDVESRQGRGSVFAVRLPLRVLSNPVQKPGSPGRLKEHALVVDDDPINGKLLAHQLKASGMQVTRVESGAAALDEARKHDFAWVLLDLHMPVMDGWEVARKLRTMKAESDTPPVALIATTADTRSEIRGTLNEAGINDLLTKPVTPKALSAVLAKWRGIASVR